MADTNDRIPRRESARQGNRDRDSDRSALFDDDSLALRRELERRLAYWEWPLRVIQYFWTRIDRITPDPPPAPSQGQLVQ